jgi:putative exporter of polyketide antibiotics
MAFAVTQANHWAADEEEGRQELVLATPQPRLAILLARFGALTTATVIIGVLTLALTALAAASRSRSSTPRSATGYSGHSSTPTGRQHRLRSSAPCSPSTTPHRTT